MSSVGARRRLIYFRVSDEELERFRTLAESKGSRSLSDLAREAMERMHHRPSDEGEVLPRLFECMNALEGKVTSMGRRLDEISSRLVNTKEAVQEGQRYEQSEN